MNTSFKRYEVILFLFSAIVLAFVVGLLSNIIFTRYYESNKTVFTWTIVILFFVLFTLLILIMLSRKENGFIRAQCVFTYCFNDMKFIDLPHCVASVRGRVKYEDVSDELKDEFYESNMKNEFWASSIRDFFNIVMQEIVLDVIINSHRFNTEKRKTLTVNDFPEKIKIRLQDCSHLSYSISVPKVGRS